MKRKTKKSKNSPSLNKFAVVLAVALLLLVQGAVAYAEDAAPASSGSSNTESAPTGSNSGNVSVGSVGVPASSNSANTPAVSAPASSNSGNVSVGSVGVPGSSNSANTGGTVPAGSNSSNTPAGASPASSNSSNVTTATTEAPANSAPVGLGGGGGGGNGSPYGYTFNSTLSQNNAMTSTVAPTSGAGNAVVNVNTGSCKPYLNSYIFSGRENDKAEVTKLQKFLLEAGYTVDVTGVYDSKTISAVEAFQLKNSDDVLRKSWGASIPSGDVYITTQLKINDIVCNKKSDFAALSYLGKQYNENLAKNANTSNTGVASNGTDNNTTVAVSGNNSSTTDSNDSQEAAVVKSTTPGFWKKVGNWFSGIFKKNK